MPASKVNTTETAPQGEIDEALANGPMTKRTCRDPICCLGFTAFVIGMVVIAIYGYSTGNPDLIGRGYDSDKKMCGIDEGYEDYPYLFFLIPLTGNLLDTVCVKTCPTANPSDDTLATVLDCHTNSFITNCALADNDLDNVYLELGTSSPVDPGYSYPSTGYLKRICIPNVPTGTYATSYANVFDSAIDTVFNSDAFGQWVSDIRETWPVIAVSIGVAFLIGFTYMFFLRYCTGILTWFAILAFIVGMAILGWQFYSNAIDIDDVFSSSGNASDDESSSQKTITTQKVIAYICWGLAIFVFLATLCLFNRIRLAIAIMKAAADYIKATPSVFLVPPVILLFMVGFYVFWGGALIFLVSSGDPEAFDTVPFGTFEFDQTLERLIIYQLFAFLWINAFFIASTQFILASSTALWYFSQGTGQEAPATIRTSVKRLFRYHLGSIAFGSLILAIVQAIRIILAYIEAKTKQMGGSENKLIIYTLKCLQCYVACFERFIKFLNKNAYIQIALSGKSFCGAAKDAFFLILHNPLRMGVLAGLGSIFILFGKIFIAALTALGAFLAVTQWDYFSEKLYSPLLPTILVFIFAYGVGAIFMIVYGLAADTILACFILDEEINKKKNAPPRHCPPSLKEFLDDNRKK